jgi:hypothetical protein
MLQINNMKELQDIAPDKTEVQAPIKKELKLLGTLKPHPGHTCFQLDIKTGEITIAKFAQTSIDYTQSDKNSPVRRKLITQDGCLYVTALNIKNAKKRFEKMINHLIKDNGNKDADKAY